MVVKRYIRGPRARPYYQIVTGSVANQHVVGSRTTLENAALRANLVFWLYRGLPLVLGGCAAMSCSRKMTLDSNRLGGGAELSSPARKKTDGRPVTGRDRQKAGQRTGHDNGVPSSLRRAVRDLSVLRVMVEGSRPREKNLALAVVAELSALRVTGFPQFPLFFKQSLALRCPQFPTRFKLSIALREWLVVVYVPRTALIRAIAFHPQGLKGCAVLLYEGGNSVTYERPLSSKCSSSLSVCVRAAVLAKGCFSFRATIQVIENGFWQTPFRQTSKIIDIHDRWRGYFAIRCDH
jgi:hypothetical protein